VSGKSRRSRSKTAWPRNPVTPVTNTFLPASLRTIEVARGLLGAIALSTTWQIMHIYHLVDKPNLRHGIGSW